MTITANGVGVGTIFYAEIVNPETGKESQACAAAVKSTGNHPIS